MAQETKKIDYEAMVQKYLNEWHGKNLRAFCLSEKVNIYRMLKIMKMIGVTEKSECNDIRPLLVDAPDTDHEGIVSRHFRVDELSSCENPADEYIYNIKLNCNNNVQVVIRKCTPETLTKLLRNMEVLC